MPQLNLREIARQAVLAADSLELTGEEKMEAAVVHLIKLIDDGIKGKGLGEAISDFLLRNALKPLLRAIVQWGFDELRAEEAV